MNVIHSLTLTSFNTGASRFYCLTTKKNVNCSSLKLTSCTHTKFPRVRVLSVEPLRHVHGTTGVDEVFLLYSYSKVCESRTAQPHFHSRAILDVWLLDVWLPPWSTEVFQSGDHIRAPTCPDVRFPFSSDQRRAVSVEETVKCFTGCASALYGRRLCSARPAMNLLQLQLHAGGNAIVRWSE